MQPDAPTCTNSFGMTFHRMEPGTFLMGNDRPLDDSLVRLSHWRYGDDDERPVHRVEISRPFYLAETPVTNAHYEEIFPEHKALRGKLGFSNDDDEAVVFVTWDDAVRYCQVLSEREGREYRLPSEAEWEYACRAGTNTAFWTGDTLPAEFENNPGQAWYPRVRDPEIDRPVPIHVGRTPANPWGLHDMHGLVEEWCLDWYDRYDPHPRTDPAGPDLELQRAGVPAKPLACTWGDFRVTRGGSHSTEAYYLRSANRSANLPDDGHWHIGFRVALGPTPGPRKRIWPSRLPLHQHNVIQMPGPGPDSSIDEPHFRGPLPYVNMPLERNDFLFGEHNHDSGFTVCPNGDLMAIWYSCVEERGRELAIAASRRRFDHRTGKLVDTWDDASLFWCTPDRNDHAPALWADGERLYHFNGLSTAAAHGGLATILRISEDSGATWSRARLIMKEHRMRQQPSAGVFALRDGTIVLPCDSPMDDADTEKGTALWMSEDNGDTWYDAGGTIQGIHASAVELSDGRLLAFGRANDIDGMMAQSVSCDRGKTWEYSASPFPGITSGQRIVLRTLRGSWAHGSDPLLLISFSNAPLDAPGAVRFTDESGVERPLMGLYAAVSFDGGETWPFVRPVSDDGPVRFIMGMDNRTDELGPDRSERKGYCAGTQSADGMVHINTSKNEYEFNLAWLVQRPPAADR